MSEGSFDEAVDMSTSKQFSNFLAAEEVLGDRIVARVLRDVWSEENLDVWCWETCSRCDKDMREGDEGFIWARPLGDRRVAKHCTLEAHCSEECVDEAIREWADQFKADLIIGYFTL